MDISSKKSWKYLFSSAPNNASKNLTIKHNLQDELAIKKLDPKHKELLKDCFKYSAIFKDLVKPIKVQVEESFNKDLKEIRDKLLDKCKTIFLDFKLRKLTILLTRYMLEIQIHFGTNLFS